jgi:hypothetical protein
MAKDDRRRDDQPQNLLLRLARRTPGRRDLDQNGFAAALGADYAS